MENVKKRKIRSTDWEKVQDYIKKTLQARRDNSFRKSHETKWAEIDRQISMEAMKKQYPKGTVPQTWKSAFELGELSKASEIITADVMRLIFPANRTWFETHCKPPKQTDPKTGKSVVAVDQRQQKLADGILRSLMAQQHLDFGLRARVELSIKEALHHGSFVASCVWESQNKVHDGKGLESISAPVWVPHSMWNCYPDMSPQVISGANIFYPGSMIIVSYMPRHQVLALKGEGYMNLSEGKIPKRKNSNKDVDTEDVELVTYYGDLVIPREDGDIYLPNSKCILANEVVIYYAPNPMPFPEVIYVGYERQDVRDPYFTSPIVKNSPIQKLATILANQFVDGVDLATTPPIVYDGHDAYMVANHGLNLWPGAQTASKGSGKFQEVKVGDPKAALMGLQMALQKLEEGTAVNAIRSGGADSDRKTATEVQNTQQGAEVRTVDFVSKIEPGALRPFLYMQHEFNLKYLDSYSFYCAEKGLPDFLTVTKDQMPKVVHFEIVGSKGLLGEQQRTQRMTAVTGFASQNPLFAPLLNAKDILIDMYEDAGVKGAEKYLKDDQAGKIPPEVQQKLQQAAQMIQQLQQELQQAQTGAQEKMAALQVQKAKDDGALALKQQQLEFDRKQAMMDARADSAEFMAKLKEAADRLALDREDMEKKFALEYDKLRAEAAAQQEAMRHEQRLFVAEQSIKAAEARAERDKAEETPKKRPKQ
jgi:hypothetical protein